MKYKIMLICSAILVFFVIYIQVMPPSFNSDDSPETTLAYVTLGIQHPPGYPLSSIIGKMFSMIPAGSYMFRANIMSAVMNMAASIFIILIILRIIGYEKPNYGLREYTAALMAASFYLFGSTVWLQGIIAKGGIYTLHAALISCVFWLLVKSEKNIKYFYLASLIYGLSFANHMQSSAVIFPAFFLYLIITLWKKAGLKNLIWGMLFFILGASLNLFVFVRSLSNPVYAWGDIKTIDDFLWLITRAQYAGMENKHTWADTANLLSYHLKNYTFKEYLPFLGILALPGVFFMAKKRPRETFLLSSAPLLLLISVAAVATPPDNTEWLIKPYLASSYLFSSIFIAFAFYILFLKINRYAVYAISAVLLTAGVFINAPDYRYYFIGYDYMNNLKNSMKPGSVLICEGDMNIGAALYGTIIMRHEYVPYIPVVSLYPWYNAQIKRNYGKKINLPLASDDIKSNIENVVKLNSEKECYYTNVFTEQWVKGLLPQPRGVLNKVTVVPALQVITDNPIKTYSFRGYIPFKIKSDEFTKRLVDQNYANGFYKIADSLRINQMNLQAVYFYKKGLYYYENDGAYVNMGLCYYAINYNDKAKESWEKAIKLNPKNSVAYSNMAFIYLAMNDAGTALEFSRKALEIDPNNATASQLIKAFERRQFSPR